MDVDQLQAEQVLRDGLASLCQEGFSDADVALLTNATAGLAKQMSWLAAAIVRHAAGDHPGKEAALDALLDLDPASLRGNVLKADCRSLAGDPDLAALFYRKALSIAGNRRLLPEDQGAIECARDALAALDARMHATRSVRLTERGLPPEQWSPRLSHALEVAAGFRRVYRPEPTAFHYPGLPTRQFYDPAAFGWAADVEAATGVIRAELLERLTRGDEDFRAYIQAGDSKVPLAENRALLDSKDWSVLPLVENGWVVPAEVRRCPRTWETILRAPVPRIAGWGPTIVFSMLKAGAHIAPHSGMFDTRLVCHLPLIVPPGCRFRVGDEVREWEVGKLLIFDDTIEHEAWNDGAEDRVVLIFDVWRPELSEQERVELTALFSD